MIAALERARAIALGVAARHAEAVDLEGRFPAETMAALKEAKLLSVFVPQAFGGEGLSVAEVSAICHLLGRSCSSSALIYAMHQIQTACIVRHGQKSAWQRDTLRRMADEQLLLASATTEGATGGDLGRSDCSVVTADERFTIDKRGAVISYGQEADLILATARRAPDAPASDQVLAVLERRQTEMTVTARWDTLGMRGTCSNTYILQGQGHVEQILPCAYGEIQSDTMVPFSHLTWASVWLGIAVDALSRARRYLRGKAAAAPGYSPAQARLVEATALLQQTKANLVTALRLYESRLAGSEPIASLAFSMTMNNVKITVSEAVVTIIQQALMICGISGYRNDSEFSVARHLRDAHSAALMVANDRIAAGMGKMALVQRVDSDLLSDWGSG